MRASAEQAVMSSAIAQGRVWHQRLQPFTHRFDYPLWMVWCDLEKIDEPVSYTHLTLPTTPYV